MTAQPDLFIPIPKAKSYASYLMWRQTEDGQRVYGVFAELALSEVNKGARRVSAKGLCEHVRHALKIQINNSFVSWIADDLIAEYPKLEAVIETRKRTKVKEARS